MLGLIIRWVDPVRSGEMTRVLFQILRNPVRAMQQGVARVLAVGRELPLRASVLAVAWGKGLSSRGVG